MNQSIVAKNTKRIIGERGYKQRAVAKLAGYDEKAFSNLLNGRRLVTDKDIIAISDALKVTPNELFSVSKTSA